MSMFKGFSNAFKIPELRKKIFITLGLVAVCRLVSQIPTPGVDWQTLQRTIEDIRTSTGGGGLFDWFEVFTGGALGQCAIGFLSIWPYISAQIVIQLLSSVIPSLEKLKKEGESGRQPPLRSSRRKGRAVASSLRRSRATSRSSSAWCRAGASRRRSCIRRCSRRRSAACSLW